MLCFPSDIHTLAEHIHLHAWFRAWLSINLSSPFTASHEDAHMPFVHLYTSTQIICLNVFKWVLVVVSINNHYASAVCASYQYNLLTLRKWDESLREVCCGVWRRRKWTYWYHNYQFAVLERPKVREVRGDTFLSPASKVCAIAEHTQPEFCLMARVGGRSS